MAEEAYLVAFDIQAAGSGYTPEKTVAKPTGFSEVSYGAAEWEGKGASNGTNGAKSGLMAHNGTQVVSCKLVELQAGSAAEAVKYVRANLAQNAGGERAVVKPNETNFQVIV